MEIREMTGEELEARKAELEARNAELAEAVNAEDADLDAIEKEVDENNAEAAEVEERMAELKTEVENREKVLAEVVNNDAVKILEERNMEEPKMDVKEIRNSAEYIDAFAEYIKNGDDTQLRALTTTNDTTPHGTGTVAIPDFVLDEVKTAWDANDIMSLVEKTEFAGNLKVQFEISGSEAAIHAEGDSAVSEEELVLGIVTLVPASIKKWISISDEVMDMRGEAFLRYIYRELTQKIVKKMADSLITIIANLPDTATSTSPCAQAVSAAPALGTVAAAYSLLSDEAARPVIVMNKLTHANFKAVQYAGSYFVDPFEGLEVHYSSALPAYDTASEDDVYMIVGDFGHGALANFPNGEGIDIKVDDKTLMTSDLVRILGREYVGLGVTACNAFALVTKPGEG